MECGGYNTQTEKISWRWGEVRFLDVSSEQMKVSEAKNYMLITCPTGLTLRLGGQLVLHLCSQQPKEEKSTWTLGTFFRREVVNLESQDY